MNSKDFNGKLQEKQIDFDKRVSEFNNIIAQNKKKISELEDKM